MPATILIVLAVVILLAWANGANDTFKGVATLWGSHTLSFRGALWWGLATTFLGSMLSVGLARGLVARFSGKGLVPETLVGQPGFLLAVGVGAGATVLLATRVGLPVSTTHALLGGLCGAAWASEGFSGVRLGGLTSFFLAPLLLGPLMAALGAAILYPPLRWWRRVKGLDEESCVCVEAAEASLQPSASAGAFETTMARASMVAPVIHVGKQTECRVHRRGPGPLGIRISTLLDVAHVAASGAVGFARGLNDTPKIAALLLLAPTVGKGEGLALVAAAMAVGGWLGSRHVARTLSWKITSLNTGQATVGSLVTAGLVSLASVAGLPVSTTHVSSGSLFGIGAVTGGARWKTIGSITTAWVVTLPLSAGLGALAAVMFGRAFQ